MHDIARALVAAVLVGLLATSSSIGQALPTVVVLSTGGTIASRQDPVKGGYVPALSATDLIAAVPAIRTLAHIETQEISNISSSDMTPQLWLQLATRINELLSRPGIAGAVVTHGTNTLEETAYFLDLTIASSKPVCSSERSVPRPIGMPTVRATCWMLFASLLRRKPLAKVSWSS